MQKPTHSCLEYSLRSASTGDIAAILRIEQEAAVRFARIGRGALVTASALSESLCERFLSEGVLFVLDHNRREPVAFVAGCVLDGWAHVAELDVLPEHAGRRLGARLLVRVHEWAVARDLHGLTLSTYRTIPWNAPYYSQLGFKEVPLSKLGPEHHQVWQGQRDLGMDMTKRLIMQRGLDAGAIEPPPR